jgi:predicted transcriptional regulator
VTEDCRRLLLSIKPHFASMILDGRKTVELRRIKPNIEPGCHALMYASSPTMSLVGSCVVARVDIGAPSTIWRRHGPQTGLSRREFDRYFEDTRRAVALVLDAVEPFAPGMSLEELRTTWHGFEPPQSFRYALPEWRLPILAPSEDMCHARRLRHDLQTSVQPARAGV